MANLKNIKTKIRSVEKSRQVTKAMEAVSAAKMRKAQVRALSGRAYARAAAGILARVSGTRQMQAHALTQARTVKKALYIVLTSDKGLAGALNSSVLRATAADIASLGLTESQVSIIAIGRKAADFFTNRGYMVERSEHNIDSISSDFIEELVRSAVTRFDMGDVDTVKIAYQNFVSTFEQRPTLRTMFPLSLSELEQVVEDIRPAKGVFSNAADAEKPNDYTIEPSEEEVLGAILPRLASIFVYHALLESQASEHSARMVAMKSASDKATDLRKVLTISFNKARQAAITREVSEITGGMEAMAV
ncbi:MAG: ATP synthase F1 subunit gamma [Candidatus Pacebacteria bacterium]|nr:ATP synthase F1 subunit gamma [Candidatus Paceibacterota bacterium]